MMSRHLAAAPALALILLSMPACAQEPRAVTAASPNSIQPETTLSISATAEIAREPDIAFITTGVTTEAETAEAALADNARLMNALMRVLKGAGIAEKDIQTSNFSLSPRYDYPERKAPRIAGFTASNNVTVRVRDLAKLGDILDTVVREGGNTFGGLSFALDDDTAVRDEARRKAMAEALARAELYAGAAGLKVRRIVTISESGGWNAPPAPMAMSRMAVADAAPSPVSGGEVNYSATVDVVFELTK